MRFQDAFFTTQGESKRQRMPNSRFQKDYVALPGLRTTGKSTWAQRSHKGKWSHGHIHWLTGGCSGEAVSARTRLCAGSALAPLPSQPWHNFPETGSEERVWRGTGDSRLEGGSLALRRVHYTTVIATAGLIERVSGGAALPRALTSVRGNERDFHSSHCPAAPDLFFFLFKKK